MEPAEQARPKAHYMRIVVLEALAVTLLAHGVMLFLFRYDPRPVKPPVDRRAGIRLFNLGTNSPARQEKILQWMNLHDPSIIARADSPHSPIARLRPSQRPSAPAFRAPAPPVAFPVRAIPAPAVLERESPPVPVVPLLSPSPETDTASHQAHYPQVFLNGKRIKLAIPEELQSLSRAVHAHPTELEMRRPSVEAPFSAERFLLLHSSGSTRLDMLAVRLLTGELATLAAPGQTVKVIIRWQDASGARQEGTAI